MKNLHPPTLPFYWFFFLLFSITTVAQKPILKNNLFLKGIAKKSTAIYKKPTKSSTKALPLKAFDIVYIYQNPRSGFYQVGPDPDRAIGYVPEEDIQEWDTRLCLHFTPLKGRKPALVFEDADPLTESLRGSEDFYDTNGKPHTNSIAMEPDDEIADQRFTMLLPILNGERKRLGTGAHMIYEIGFLTGGDVTYDAVPESSKRKSSKIAELELMFLIDATGSMGPYIEGCKEIIKNVTQRIIDSRESGCRFGITAYRDYADEFIYKQFSDLTANSKNVIYAIDEIEAGGGGDTPEAVYDGFQGVITETSWHESQNTLRLAVLIGDASAHRPGAVGNPKNISADQLIQQASEEKVRTLAVKIVTGGGDTEGETQFKFLTEGLTEADKGQYIEVDYAAGGSDFITKTSAKIEAEINRLEKLIKVVEDSKWGEPVFPTGTSSTDRAIILKNIKIEPGSPRPIEFSTGWINETNPDGSKVVNSYVYMTKDEFDRMLRVIQAIGKMVRNPDKVLDGTIKKIIEAATGETLKGTDIEAHYKKTFSLPVKTDLLKIPVDELPSWGEERKNRLLKLIDGKYNQLELWSNNLENWNNAPGKSGFKYAFVPVDMLP